MPSFTLSRKAGGLAIFGGEAEFSPPLHVNRPNAGDRATFDAYANTIWEGRWFTNNGPLAETLEARLTELLRVRHCVLMTSGTAAMMVLVQSLGLKGEVILPSYTFISTAHILQSAGILPVFCDIDPDSWNLDCEKCEALITERTSAIIPTHLWGKPADIERLEDMAARHQLPLLFDAAHAFGCSHAGKPVGRFGTAEVFSFQANKSFHCGEGGAVTTNDDRLAEKLRAMRNFGFTGYDRVEHIGTNAKLSELSAALGLTNLASHSAHVDLARQVHERYRGELQGLSGVSFHAHDGNHDSNYQYVVLTIDPQCALSRDEIVKILHAENMLVRRYFHPGCHGMEPYRTIMPDVADRLPVTIDRASRVIVLPAGAAISMDEVERASSLIRLVADNAADIKKRLETS